MTCATGTERGPLPAWNWPRGRREMKYVLVVLALLVAGPAFAQEPGSKLYIVQEGPSKTVEGGNKVVTTTPGSFQLVLQAAMLKEKVPFTLITDRAQADYTMSWDIQTGQRPYPYSLSASLASSDGRVVWAGSAAGENLNYCAAVIARHLKGAMKHKK
jgi:hypothetical protein